MAKYQYILHKFIYSSSNANVSTSSKEIKANLLYGIVISAVVHFCILSFMFYQKYLAPFELYDVVDKDSHVEWITLQNPKFNKLKNPARSLTFPKKIIPFEKLKQVDKQKTGNIKNQINKKEDKTQLEDSGKKTTTDTTTTTPPSTPQKFGQINSRPIKEILKKVYEKYKQGELDIGSATFSITITFKVLKDGSISDVKIIKSSGFPQIDEAALNVANAVSESHALSPLASLTSTAITFDNGPSFSSLRVVGFAADSQDAGMLAVLFKTALSFAEYKQRESQPEVAEMLKNMQIKAEGKRLAASIVITRSQASLLIKKTIGKTT